MKFSLTSALPRFGLKGRGAAVWLAAQGVPLPAQPNGWTTAEEGSRVLRLGRSEYLIEGPLAQYLERVWLDGLTGLVRVPRYDAGFVLEGADIPARLAEICALDTRPAAVGDHLLLTLAAGISVILAMEAEGRYRLWCDASYGDYLQATLQQLLDSSDRGKFP